MILSVMKDAVKAFKIETEAGVFIYREYEYLKIYIYKYIAVN